MNSNEIKFDGEQEPVKGSHIKQGDYQKQHLVVVHKERDCTIFRAEIARKVKSQTVYAVCWINMVSRGVHDRGHITGTGRTTGYGYHMASAALGEAIKHAGVVLPEDIGGRGDQVMEAAAMAIAIACCPGSTESDFLLVSVQ